MKRIEKSTVITAIQVKEDVEVLLNDAIGTIRQAMELERHLYGTHVMGNHTADVEAKLDAVFAKQSIDTFYDIARYECIEGINEILGGNVIDMTGTDKQVCKRFFAEFHVYATA